MKNPFLFIHNSEDSEATDSLSIEPNLLYLKNADKETLISIIEALLNNNDALRKYIHLLERKYE